MLESRGFAIREVVMRLSLKGVSPASLLVLAALLPACGSRQSVEEVEVGVVESFDCIGETWAEPPAQIGQVPPDAYPTAADVDPFLDSRPASAPSTAPPAE